MNGRSPVDWETVREWLDRAGDRIEEALDRMVERTDAALDAARPAVARLWAAVRRTADRVRDEVADVAARLAVEVRGMGRALAEDTRVLAELSDRRGRALRAWAAPRLRLLRRRVRRGLAGVSLPAGVRLRRRHLALAALAVVIVSGLLYANCGVAGCPDVSTLKAFQPGGASVLLDRHGAHYADLAPFERAVVRLDSLPEHLPAAFIAVEDHRFYQHRGIDPARVVGAALSNLRARRVQEGSSTIPMQLARNVFPDRLPGSERTMRRKLQEARVAGLIERRYTKDEILELYLNHIYFGAGAYGVEAASRVYFGKAAAELTLAEAATLAALPRAPSHYDPRRHPERARERRDLVLGLMEKHRLAEMEEALDARATELAIRANGRDRSGIPLGAYFVDVIRDQLEDRFGEALYRRRLVVHTTLDSVLQAAAERELEAQLASLDGRVRPGAGGLQGAVVVLDAHSGDVLALVGGRDPATSRYNRALRGRRQVGSAFKPFVFAAAIERGVPTSQMIHDTPLRMQLSRNDVWQPSNYDGRFEGRISLRQALVRSRNVPTVRLATTVGVGDVAATARLAGLRDPMDETPALALGTVATSPLRLATAYTAFATLGHTTEPRFLLRVEDERGRVLWEAPRPEPERTLDPGVAYVITDILRDAVDYGTGTAVRRAGFRGPVAGKTGTTNNATDTWFVGYTSDLVGAVWIGYDTPSPLGAGATGGGFAAPVWGRVMREAYGGRRRPGPVEWPVPAGVEHRRVDPWTGHAIQAGCYSWSAPATEVFTSRNLPATTCPQHDHWQEWRAPPARGRPLGRPLRGGR